MNPKTLRTMSHLGEFTMKYMTKLLAWIGRRQHFGVTRFWLTRIIYKIFPFPVTRNKRLDFILQYLPRLSMVYWIMLPVLDVGCVDSLLMYELRRRKYAVSGIDIRDYQTKLPKDILFYKQDITDPNIAKIIDRQFYAIIATSVIELINAGMYGEERTPEAGDRKAIENIHELLMDKGYLILSVPTTFWRNINARGYTFFEFYNLVAGLFVIIDIKHLGGHICAVLAKRPKEKEGKK